MLVAKAVEQRKAAERTKSAAQDADYLRSLGALGSETQVSGIQLIILYQVRI